jgi:hypothetical protein
LLTSGLLPPGVETIQFFYRLDKGGECARVAVLAGDLLVPEVPPPLQNALARCFERRMRRPQIIRACADPKSEEMWEWSVRTGALKRCGKRELEEYAHDTA